jgi:predicted nuclease of predicted toxin-antitoxin system
MKLLLDANISWRLALLLMPHFEECIHIDKTGLEIPAKDIAIWVYAKREGFIIVTNDDDFLNLSNLKGFPPKIVLLRTGNQSNSYLLELLIRHKDSINSFIFSEEIGVLEIFGS